MIVQLPVDSVDSLTTFHLINTGYTRTMEVGIIIYCHPQQGTINLRRLDNNSTEVSFSYPYLAKLADILPVMEAAKMESRKVVSGIDYPEDVVQMLTGEYDRRVACKQSLINDLCNKFAEEEARIKQLSTGDSRSKIAETESSNGNQPAENSMANDPNLVNPPSSGPKIEDLSDNEKLCLAWTGRDYLSYKNMDDFLEKNGQGNYNDEGYITKDQFKVLLQEAGRKGILVKIKGRWKTAPDYVQIAATIRKLHNY